MSQFWREFCRLIGAKASLTPGYHLEANSQTERLNQQLETGLRCVVRIPLHGAKHLVWVEYSQKRRPAPAYQPGQRIWLSAKDLVSFKRLASQFVGPFPITRVVGPVVVWLCLPRSLCIHLTFHVIQVKPTKENSMVPADAPPTPPEVIEGGPV